MNDRLASTEQLQALDRDHYLHPFTDHKALAARGTRVITSADGVYLTDSDGQKIFDAMSGLWCVNIGYGRKELAEAGYRQLLELPFYNSFFQTAHPPAIELSERLAGIAQPHLNRVFYTGSGSEANDTVVRMVRRYWDLTGAKNKHTIISRHNAYHGSTVAAASLGGMKPMHSQGGLPIPGVVHIDQPYWFDYDGPLDEHAFGVAVAGQLEQKIDELGEDRVAAFIAEPVQGAGGVIVPPDSYWPEIRRICSERKILLVVDEVICGFGRTGEWFGSDYYGLEPDLMPIAKGLSSGYLPIGGVMVSDRVADTLIGEGGEFYHGFTYSGHPAACAVALANIGLLESEGVVEQVRETTGPYLQERWRELAGHPLVGEARGLGFLGAIELVADKTSGARFDKDGTAGTLCRDLCFANGLVMRAVGDTMIIAPPLITSKAQIDELLGLVWRCLDLTEKQLKS
ncbi:MAG: aspartate aminotransferase family protein [Pseudomonadota bacterium]